MIECDLIDTTWYCLWEKGKRRERKYACVRVCIWSI